MATKALPWILLASIVYATEQQIFSYQPSNSGLLRRFALNGTHIVRDILTVSEEHDLDIWHASESTIDIYFPHSTDSNVPEKLLNIAHTTIPISSNWTISSSEKQSWNLSSLENSTYHADYHPLYEIEQFIHELAELEPNLTRVVKLGHSAEAREMYGVEISRQYDASFGPVIDPTRKLGIVILGPQHAREWVASSAALYLVHALVANSSSGHSLSSLLDTFNFYIIPSPNPDGYAYTWSTDRFWYKNRQILGPFSRCVGLDMNRQVPLANWGYKWKPTAPTLVNGKKDKKKKKKQQKPADECSHWFPGHRAFESPEVNNLANYLTTLPNIAGFVNLRSYGQMLSTPYSYSPTRVPKDAEDQSEAAMGAVHAVKRTYGTTFTTGRLSQTLYPAGGNILDYAYSRGKIKFSFTAHLRDTGTYGFTLPPEWIKPVGEETGQMIRYLADFIKFKFKR